MSVQSRYQVIQIMFAIFVTCLGIAFLTESHTHISVIVSLVWLWLGPADLHAHL